MHQLSLQGEPSLTVVEGSLCLRIEAYKLRRQCDIMFMKLNMNSNFSHQTTDFLKPGFVTKYSTGQEFPFVVHTSDPIRETLVIP